MLIDDICDAVLPAATNRSVADLRVGLGYTAVQLDDGRCGLAYTLRDKIGAGCCVIQAAGTLSGTAAADLAKWARTSDPIAAAVGLAVLNALIDPPPDAVEGDLAALLETRPDDVIGMVGQFGPLIEPLRRRCKALHVIERAAAAQSGLLAESSAGAVLPECQIAILTATALLNRTLDNLLDLCRNAREIAILGPSTPLLPRVFAPRGVTLLSGVQVTDPGRVLRLVSEGGGTRQLGRSVRKLTIRMGRRRAIQSQAQ